MLEYDIENTINTIKDNVTKIGNVCLNAEETVIKKDDNVYLIGNIETNNNSKRCSPNGHSIARKRWQILARAISKNGNESTSSSNCSSIDSGDLTPSSPQPSDDEFLASVRRFKSFDLIQQNHISSDEKENLLGQSENWFIYKLSIDHHDYFVNIHHINRPITALDLMGFNNTGNICIWPSEEALSFYCLSMISNFAHKSVLELGGGMTCLAGLLIAKYGHPYVIHLTDGNAMSVDNVRRTCRLNDFSDCYVKCSILKWENHYNEIVSECGKFDYILSADCLFFDEARASLIDTIWYYLSENGQAIVMAPKRGSTLDIFTEQANAKGFICQVFQHYNDDIWQRHIELKKSNVYDENIHYPILIILKKSSSCNIE